jgi:glycosyltransferase involved in cell wall biosynthesis
MPRRVLHIITGLKTGGAERSLFNLLDSSLRNNFEHHILSLSGIGHYGPQLQAMGFPVHALNLRGVGGLLGTIGRLRSLTQQIAPDLIQGWMYHGSMAASIAGRFTARPTPLAWNIRQSLYDITTENRNTQWVIRMLQLASNEPNAIIYNSFQSRAHHEAFGFSANNAVVIPNGFDTEQWRPDWGRRHTFRRAVGIADEYPVAGFVGRFHPQKDVPTFLKACAVAMAENPMLHVVMVGEGLTTGNSALSELYAQIPAPRLHALGRRDDIEHILPGFDLFCLSSSSEAFPNVLGEAMACGLPCIATNVGDCARLLDDNGQIIAAGDFIQMAEAMGKLAMMDADYRKKIGGMARARIISSYSLDATVAAYANLYHSITETRPMQRQQ